MAKRTALGKGLDALLGETAAILQQQTDTTTSPAAVREIELDKIEPNPYQPRENFDQEAMEDLVASIMALGIIQPVTLRLTAEDRYQIISGERRYRAARAAGLTTIPAYVRQADEEGMIEMALVENLQRADLDPIETALGLRRLIEECHLTQDALAHRIGKSRAAVTNSLRLLTLEPELQKALRCGDLSTGHAKVLLSIEDSSLRLAMGEAAIANGWSVRRLEERLRERERESLGHTETLVPDSFVRAVGTVGRFCENRVTVRRRGNNGGTMTIIFRNGEQLEQFLNALESR